MASEDQDQDALLAKIGQLAGQINRHKNGTAPVQSHYATANNASYASNSHHSAGYNPYGAYRPRGGQPSRPYGRGARPVAVHRHRSLVLNNGIKQEPNEENPSASRAWVVKNDRHRQLINPAIYEQVNEKRVKAMEETRKQRSQKRNDYEKTKLIKHLQRNSYHPASAPGTNRDYEIDIQGIKFHVAKNGSKLVKASGDTNAARITPKFAEIGGVKFHRTKNGNLYRAAIFKAHSKPRAIKKIDALCQTFATTGSCYKGPTCRYIHDSSKVSICKQFLLKGTCPSGDSCDLSHELTPERTPACLHFAKGHCSNASCRYMHVRVSPLALVCRSFGTYGYCDKGNNCAEKHVHECPDFSNTGSCPNHRCKLIHREKASLMRSNAARGSQSGEDDASDISSDEDGEEIGSDDVDSDDLDGEFLGDDDGLMDLDMPTQKDFVQL